MRADTDEDIAKVLPSIYVVALAGADQGIEDRGAVATGIAAEKKIIFSAQRDGAQCILCEIVVRFQVAILDEARQRRPLIDATVLYQSSRGSHEALPDGVGR